MKAFTKSLVFTTLELPLKGCAAYLALSGLRASLVRRIKAVSYTHLDVYKRQVLERVKAQAFELIKISDHGSGETDLLDGAEFTIKLKADVNLSLIHI